MPPRSRKAPYSVRFLTVPRITPLSDSFFSVSSRSALYSVSTTARRDTTTLSRRRSSLMILNSSSRCSR